MELIISDRTCTLIGQLAKFAPLLQTELEGRKMWPAHNRLQFENTPFNVRRVKELLPVSTLSDRRGVTQAFDVPSAHGAIIDRHEIKRHTVAIEPRMPMHDYQQECFDKFKDMATFALFSEQGTGKTKTVVDIACYRWLSRQITGIMVFSSPKGVHRQWVDQQIPRHVWTRVGVRAFAWDGKGTPDWQGTGTDRLEVFSGNIDMLAHERAMSHLSKFFSVHNRKLMVVVDESDSIKNASTLRNKNLRKLCEKYGVQFRTIMTGTPIAKDLTDEWAQFLFLDPAIIGHKYKTTFQSQYCKMGGWENKSVVGHRNLDHFKQITAPYVFRATKEMLNLPEKVYDELVFDQTDEQRKHIKSLKENFLTAMKSGEAVTVLNAASLLVRVQQISCGYLVDEDENTHWLDRNPRLDALHRLRDDVQGKVIVWCRFHQDVESISKSLGERAVAYFGPMGQVARTSAIAAFTNEPGIDTLIATPGSAGRGIDGLQDVCSTAIYYSNDFNAVNRWQSEDRIHRIGQKATATYFDLIARGSVDRNILRNLKAKKDLSVLVLDDLKHMIEEL